MLLFRLPLPYAIPQVYTAGNTDGFCYFFIILVSASLDWLKLYHYCLSFINNQVEIS